MGDEKKIKKIIEAKKHLYLALEGILAGGCKHETSVNLQVALQYLCEFIEEDPASVTGKIEVE